MLNNSFCPVRVEIFQFLKKNKTMSRGVIIGFRCGWRVSKWSLLDGRFLFVVFLLIITITLPLMMLNCPATYIWCSYVSPFTIVCESSRFISPLYFLSLFLLLERYLVYFLSNSLLLENVGNAVIIGCG